jgi:hypothetical protein
MAEETRTPGMVRDGRDISEIREEGFNHYKKTLKFGDIIENGHASTRNPQRFGIVVKARGHSINCTDGDGRFWDLCFDFGTKIMIHGSVLVDDFKSVINSKK